MDTILIELTQLVDPIEALKKAWSIDPEKQHSLIYSYPSLRSRGYFFLRVATYLLMPAEIFEGVSCNDYFAARWFILDKLDEIAKSPISRFRNQLANKRLRICWQRSFYPEYRESDRRKRVVHFAEQHLGMGHDDPQMIVLCSLGGDKSLKEATAAANPSGTTCGVFVRAVLVAAGDRRCKDWKAGPQGEQLLDWYIGAITPPQRHSYRHEYIPYKNGDSRYPQPGDVYVISGGKRTSKGDDSSHAGIITKVVMQGDDWLFTTVDGGQLPTGKRTITYNRTFRGPNKALENDKYQRRLTGWVDVEKIAQWL